MNDEDTKPQIPVRTWGDLWKFAAVIAMLIASYTAVQLQIAWHTSQIQELKDDKISKDSFVTSMEDVKQRLVRIENKLDAEADARSRGSH